MKPGSATKLQRNGLYIKSHERYLASNTTTENTCSANAYQTLLRVSDTATPLYVPDTEKMVDSPSPEGLEIMRALHLQHTYT